MSGDEKQYKSRLNPGQSPTRGIGAAYAQNQRLIGSSDPEQAAKLAAMSPEDAAEEQARLERVQADAEAMREDLLIAIVDGQWTPEESPAEGGAKGWKKHLAALPVGTIQRMHQEMNAAVEAAIDEEAEEQLEATLGRTTSIDVDDPLYNPLTDKARRQAIEAKLKPLSFEDMVFKGYTEQDVEVRPGFVLTFRTIGTQHGLWLEYFMSQQEDTSYQHTRHLFSLMQLACGLHAINGKLIGQDLSKYTKDDDTTRANFKQALEEKMEFIGTKPSDLSDDWLVQFTWFSGRVRKMLAGDTLRKVGNS